MEQPSGSRTPLLVEHALSVADSMGFAKSCSPETGKLLRVLAAQVQDGVIGEIGTGCGVGAAWMVAALRPNASFVTVEIDERLARAAEEVIGSVPNAQVICGDWRAILEHQPFALLFADAAAAKQQEPETLFAALRPGGLLVLDDLTPGREADPLREFWLTHPQVAASEILVSPTEAVILATRIE